MNTLAKTITFLGFSVILVLFQNCGGNNSYHLTDNSKNQKFDLQGPDQNINAAAVRKTPKIISSHVLIADSPVQPSFNLYGIELFSGRLYMGGWALESNIGSDQLYTASYSLQNGVPSVSNQLTPLKWNNAGYSAGQIPGFHVNDASVIKAPGQNWQFMYYTLLDNQFATEASMTKKNWVGFASSTDGGATWFNHGPIIKQNNGVNMTGAWAPSALVESDHIRLYYHTGDKSCLSDNDPCTHPAVAQPPRVHMSRMANNGWQRLSSHQITDMSGHPLILTNVDVVKNGSKYYLTGNTPDLLKIELYESSNGIQFKAVGSSSTLISTSQSHWITTPHLRVLDKNILEVAFSYHTPTSYGFPMAKSSHTWKVLLP